MLAGSCCTGTFKCIESITVFMLVISNTMNKINYRSLTVCQSGCKILASWHSCSVQGVTQTDSRAAVGHYCRVYCLFYHFLAGLSLLDVYQGVCEQWVEVLVCNLHVVHLCLHHGLEHLDVPQLLPDVPHLTVQGAQGQSKNRVSAEAVRQPLSRSEAELVVGFGAKVGGRSL